MEDLTIVFPIWYNFWLIHCQMVYSTFLKIALLSPVVATTFEFESSRQSEVAQPLTACYETLL